MKLLDLIDQVEACFGIGLAISRVGTTMRYLSVQKGMILLGLLVLPIFAFGQDDVKGPDSSIITSEENEPFLLNTETFKWNGGAAGLEGIGGWWAERRWWRFRRTYLNGDVASFESARGTQGVLPQQTGLTANEIKHFTDQAMLESNRGRHRGWVSKLGSRWMSQRRKGLILNAAIPPVTGGVAIRVANTTVREMTGTTLSEAKPDGRVATVRRRVSISRSMGMRPAHFIPELPKYILDAVRTISPAQVVEVNMGRVTMSQALPRDLYPKAHGYFLALEGQPIPTGKAAKGMSVAAKGLLSEGHKIGLTVLVPEGTPGEYGIRLKAGTTLSYALWGENARVHTLGAQMEAAAKGSRVVSLRPSGSNGTLALRFLGWGLWVHMGVNIWGMNQTVYHQGENPLGDFSESVRSDDDGTWAIKSSAAGIAQQIDNKIRVVEGTVPAQPVEKTRHDD